MSVGKPAERDVHSIPFFIYNGTKIGIRVTLVKRQVLLSLDMAKKKAPKKEKVVKAKGKLSDFAKAAMQKPKKKKK